MYFRVHFIIAVAKALLFPTAIRGILAAPLSAVLYKEE